MAAHSHFHAFENLSALRFGAHFAVFYDSAEHLHELLVGYFAPGLANNEQCLFVTPAPAAAEQALRSTSTQLGSALDSGQLKTVSAQAWYLCDGRFDEGQVRRAWLACQDDALARGFSGVRAAADEAWLALPDWPEFAAYEARLDEVFAPLQVICLCAYPLQNRSAVEVFDVVGHHNFTLAHRGGVWEPIHGSALQRAHHAIQALNADLEQRVVSRTGELAAANERLRHELAVRQQAVDALRQSETDLAEAQRLTHLGNWSYEIGSDSVRWSDELYRIFDAERGEFSGTYETFLARVHPEDRERVEAMSTEARATGLPFQVEYRIITRAGAIKQVREVGYSRRDSTGAVVSLFGTAQDVTERKRADEALRLQVVRMRLLADVSRTLAEAGPDVLPLLGMVARRAAKLIGDGCLITRLAEDGRRFRPIAFHHSSPFALQVLRDLMLNWPGEIETPTAIHLLAGEPVHLPEVTPADVHARLHPAFWTYAERVGLHSLLIVPLRIHGQVIGALGMLRDQPGRPYTLEDRLLLEDLSDRAALAMQNARLFESVNTHRKRLRALSARLVEAQELERRRLAREFHDEIGQQLTALRVSLQMGSRHVSGAVRASLDEAEKLVGRLMDQIQDLSLTLRPTMLDDLGLAPALVWLMGRYTQQTGIEVRFEQRDLGGRFAPEIETAAYRLIQEALTNVARHSAAQEAAVHLWTGDGALNVQIDDPGVGFDVVAALAAAESSGLSGMRERVELLGGELTIESAPGAGTQITAEIPLHAQPETQTNEYFHPARG